MSSDTNVSEPLIRHHRYSRAEYHAMGRAGIFHEDDRVELIDGEVVDMAPIGKNHVGPVDVLTEVLVTSLLGRALVSIQNPIALDDYSEPQPDVVVYRYRKDRYRNRTRGPGDTLLVIEVADSSLRYDTQVKLPMFARRGVPQVWIVDVQARRIIRYSNPTPERYQTEVAVDDLAAVRVPGVNVTVDLGEVFG